MPISDEWVSGAAKRGDPVKLLAVPSKEINVHIAYKKNLEENRPVCIRSSILLAPQVASALAEELRLLSNPSEMWDALESACVV